MITESEIPHRITNIVITKKKSNIKKKKKNNNDRKQFIFLISCSIHINKEKQSIHIIVNIHIKYI